MIEDFVIQEPVLFGFPGTRNLDYRKIIGLSDEDFAELHLELMTEYRDKDGWWSEGRIPRCSECKEVIPGPEQLRRYYGRSLHPHCFRKVYRPEEEKGVSRQYWDRVARLGSDGNKN